MRFLRITLIASLALGLACGDDDGGDVDAGGTDAGGVDAGGGTDSGTDSGMPPMDAGGEDAGTDAGTAQECDPFEADSCGDGAKCAVALEADEAGDIVDVYFACVEGDRFKGEGVLCSFNQDVTPDDTTDDVIADDCQQGFFCTSANRPGPAPLAVCQRMCDGETTDCGEDGICLGANSDPFFGFCQTASNCDPVYQTGCDEGQACYVLGATNGDLVADCFDWEPAEGEDGMEGSACEFLDQCAPGLSCRPTSDTGGACFSFCEVPGEETDAGTAPPDAGALPDAGTPEDGGVAFSGECGMDLECLPLEPGDMAEVRTPTMPGICVTPEEEM